MLHQRLDYGTLTDFVIWVTYLFDDRDDLWLILSASLSQYPVANVLFPVAMQLDDVCLHCSVSEAR